MPQASDLQPPKIRSRLLRDFYNQLTRFEYANPLRAYQLVDELLQDIDEYTGPPDTWHNAAMVASRLNHPRRLEIIRAGLREWTNEVDLLCDDLQFCYGAEYDAVRAQEVWSQLEAMGPAETGSYWRFWVYGAIYHARMGRVQEGLDLLDRGILAVKRDGLMDVFRGYRSVLVDHVPIKSLTNDEDLVLVQQETLEILRSRLILGINLGIENGYALAQELARLYQEMAGVGYFNGDVGGFDYEGKQRAVDENLRKALAILHLAECLYTGNPSHPIQDIYARRINILMALHEYDEASKLLSSLPPTQHRLEEQRIALETMRRYATLKTGGSLSEGEKETDASAEGSMEQAFNEVINLLFSSEGEALERLGQRNPHYRQIILSVAARLS